MKQHTRDTHLILCMPVYFDCSADKREILLPVMIASNNQEIKNTKNIVIFSTQVKIATNDHGIKIQKKHCYVFNTLDR